MYQQGINFYLAGLPDNAVKESQQRIDYAIKTNLRMNDNFL
jgi:predicted ATPase with chaperone activity